MERSGGAVEGAANLVAETGGAVEVAGRAIAGAGDSVASAGGAVADAGGRVCVAGLVLVVGLTDCDVGTVLAGLRRPCQRGHI